MQTYHHNPGVLLAGSRRESRSTLLQTESKVWADVPDGEHLPQRRNPCKFRRSCRSLPFAQRQPFASPRASSSATAHRASRASPRRWSPSGLGPGRSALAQADVRRGAAGRAAGRGDGGRVPVPDATENVADATPGSEANASKSEGKASTRQGQALTWAGGSRQNRRSMWASSARALRWGMVASFSAGSQSPTAPRIPCTTMVAARFGCASPLGASAARWTRQGSRGRCTSALGPVGRSSPLGLGPISAPAISRSLPRLEHKPHAAGGRASSLTHRAKADRALIEAMIINANATVEELGRLTGVSRARASTRLTKLAEQGLATSPMCVPGRSWCLTGAGKAVAMGEAPLIDDLDRLILAALAVVSKHRLSIDTRRLPGVVRATGALPIHACVIINTAVVMMTR